jgi:hypothetical protein
MESGQEKEKTKAQENEIFQQVADERYSWEMPR